MLAAVMLGGCATPGVETDLKLGRETAAEVEEDMGLVSDGPMPAYVEQLGRRIASYLPASPFVYRFSIVDEPGPHAFAVAGGHIYLARGLLALAMSEDELAGVLAHEIQHVEQRHTIRQMQKEEGLGVLALPAMVAGVISEDLGSLMGKPFAAIVAGYSREQEREADRLGQLLMARAGYDPKAAPAILRRLGALEALSTRGDSGLGLFDTHPSDSERVQTLTRRAESIRVSPRRRLVADSGAILSRLDGLLIGPDPAKGVVRDNVFLHPVADFYVAMPKGWKLVNTRQVIAAVAPEEDAIVMLDVFGRGEAGDPARLAEALIERLAREHKFRPTEARTVKVGGKSGYIVVLTDTTGEKPAWLHVLWIELGGLIYEIYLWSEPRGLIYRLISASPESRLATLRGIVGTMRPLTDGEKASITEVRLRIARARQGETLDALSRRTGNVLTLEETAIFNDLDANARLVEGHPVKIGARSLFRPR